jgi:hypothetical protein
MEIIRLAGVETIRRLVQRMATERDTVAVWGGQHLAGLATGVRETGFTRVDTDWHAVTVLPTVASALWGWVRATNRRISPPPRAHAAGAAHSTSAVQEHRRV